MSQKAGNIQQVFSRTKEVYQQHEGESSISELMTSKFLKRWKYSTVFQSDKMGMS